MRALALFALVAIPLGAQTRIVPLDEALRLARSQSIDVLRADASVRSARATSDAQAALRWPSLSLSSSAGQRYGLSFDQTAGGLTQETVESVDLGLNVRYAVFDGYERRARAQAATASLREAELNRARAAQLASEAVLQGYLDVEQAKAARMAAIEVVAAEEALLGEVDAQVDLGERPAYERAQQRERVAAARGAVLTAERDLALAEARLIRGLGLDASVDHEFVADHSLDAVELDGDLVGRALSGRADLRAAARAIDAADANRRVAWAQRLPGVTLSADIGTRFSSATETAFIGQFGDNRGGGVRIGVSVPLYDRGVAREQVRLAEARASSVQAEAEQARRDVAYEVQEHLVQLAALQAQAQIAEVRVVAADEALAAERARYDAGETTLQAVSLLQARAAEAGAERQRLAVAARFERLFLRLALGDDVE